MIGALTRPTPDQKAAVVAVIDGGLVTDRRSRFRPLLFAAPFGLVVALLAVLTDLRRGQDWYGDLWAILVRDIGAGAVVAACSYGLQRSLEGWWSATSAGEVKNRIHHRIAHWARRPTGDRPARRPRSRSWQAPAAVPVARAWSVLVAWGWLLQLRANPDRSHLVLLFVVAAHLVFAAGVPLGGYLRRIGTPVAGDEGRYSRYLTLTMVYSFVGAVLLLLIVLREGFSTGGAQVSVPVWIISVQPTELARLLFVVAFVAAISGARILDGPRGTGRNGPAVRARVQRFIRPWWNRRLPWLRIPLSTVTLGGTVAFASAFLFWRLDDLSPYLVMVVTLIVVVLVVMRVARLKFALLLVLALFVGLPVVNSGLDSVPFLRDQGDKLTDRYDAAREPINLVHDGAASYYDTQQTQLGQALIGVERGLPWGRGLGNGVAADVVPAAHNDFILAILVEEWGALGLAAVVALYGLLLWRAFGLAVRSSAGFGQTLSLGLITALCVQLAFVVAGMGRLFPHGGLTVPMLSAGGSSLVMTGLLLGTVAGTSATRVDERRPTSVTDGSYTGLARRLRRVRLIGLVAWPAFCVWMLVLVPITTVREATIDRDPTSEQSADGPQDPETFLARYERRYSVRRPTIRTRGRPAESEQIAVTTADSTCAGYSSPSSPGPSFGSADAALVRCYPQRALYSDLVGMYTPGGGRVVALEEVIGRVDGCTSPGPVTAVFLGADACGPVRDVEITVRSDTQEVAAELLTAASLVETGALPALDANGGTRPTVAATIVSDPRTGEVEALTGSPSFDPNPRARPGAEAAPGRDPFTFADAAAALSPGEKDWARSALYAASQAYGWNPLPGLPLAEGEVSAMAPARNVTEPVSRFFRFPMGSTMKVVTSVAALEAEDRAFDDEDSDRIAALALDSRPPTDHVPGLAQVRNGEGGACGGRWQDMLAVSCNTGFSNLALDIGREELREVAERFGLAGDQPRDRLDGLSLAAPPDPFRPFVPDPNLSDDENDRLERSHALQAIGLGSTEATVADVAAVVNTIAHGGTRMPWRLLPADVCGVRAEARLAPCDEKGEQVISADVAEEVWSAMVRVVEDEAGTAHDALAPLLEDYADNGLQIGAKTGSASAVVGGGNVGWCVAVARWNRIDEETEEVVAEVRTFVTAVQAPAELGVDGAGVCASVAPLIREVVGA